MILGVLCVLFGILVIKLLVTYRQRTDMSYIPGPPRPFWDLLKTKPRNVGQKLHIQMSKLEKIYGPIINISEFRQNHVLVCDYDTIYQVMVKGGEQFGGRAITFRTKHAMSNTGILLSKNPDAVWRTLRKVSQKHLRQFGDGYSRLESIISNVAEDMFDEFDENAKTPFDPSSVIFDTALNSIAFLITGERTRSGDTLVEMMREYEALFLKTLAIFAPWSFKLLDEFPWLKYMGFDNWRPYTRFVHLGQEIWKVVNEMNDSNPESESICKVLGRHGAAGEGDLSETDAKSTALSLLFAGVTTTSATFYATINILAHHRDVQDKLLQEICTARKEREHVSLPDRPQMPYTRAVIFEILRYTTVVPRGVGHRVVVDTELKGYKIPAGTMVHTSLWNLHHNEEFWGNPQKFQPERFLDPSGDIVPADHPNRTHLMPFGAGTRVCLGESLALARIFLWLTTLVTRFEISPAPGNPPASCDPRLYTYEGVFRPVAYQVLFGRR